MLTAIHSPVGSAQGQTIDAIIAAYHASARLLQDAVNKAPHESFSQQLALVVKAKTQIPARQCRPRFTAESAESFGEQIKEAAETKQSDQPTHKQHQEQVDRERDRYAQLRPRTASE